MHKLAVVDSLSPHLVLTTNVNDPQFDGVVVVADTEERVPAAVHLSLGSIKDYLAVS
jgi:hypothetical protein